MTPTTASRLAGHRSRQTIHNWCRKDPTLSTLIGDRTWIIDEVFFAKITDGSGLLTWEQTKMYATSIVGTQYLMENLSFLTELEYLIPGNVTWTVVNFGYWSNACVPWTAAAHLIYQHEHAARHFMVELEKIWLKRDAWRGVGQ